MPLTPSVKELLSDPSYLGSRLPSNELSSFARNNQVVQDFFDEVFATDSKVCAVVLVQCYPHNELRAQLLAYIMAKSPAEKLTLVTSLFDKLQDESSLIEATWLAGLAYLAANDASLLIMLQTVPFKDKIQQIIQQYNQDPNYYFAAASYKPFFLTFRVENFHIEHLGKACEQHAVAIPLRDKIKGTLIVPHFKGLPWTLLDMPTLYIIGRLCKQYQEFADYFWSHYAQLHITVNNQGLSEMDKMIHRYYPFANVDLNNIHKICQVFEYFLEKNNSVTLSSHYFFDILVHYPTLFFQEKNAYPRIQRRLFQLLFKIDVFVNHFHKEIINYALFCELVSKQIDSADVALQHRFYDALDQLMMDYMFNVNKQCFKLFLKNQLPMILKSPDRYPGLLMFAIICQLIEDMAVINQLTKSFFKLSVIQLVTIGNQTLFNMIYALIELNQENKYQSLCKQICRQLINAPAIDIDETQKLAMLTQLHQSEIKGSFGLVALDVLSKQLNGSHIERTMVQELPEELLVLSENTVSFLLQCIQESHPLDYHYLNALNKINLGLTGQQKTEEEKSLRATQLGEGIDGLEQVIDSNNRAIANGALRELTHLAQQGIIEPDHVSSLPKSLQSENDFHLNTLYALYFVTQLDLSLQINMELFQHVIKMLLINHSIQQANHDFDELIWAENNFNVKLPFSAAKNIYRFYQSWDASGEQLTPQLCRFKNQYVEYLEKNAFAVHDQQPILSRLNNCFI